MWNLLTCYQRHDNCNRKKKTSDIFSNKTIVIDRSCRRYQKCQSETRKTLQNVKIMIIDSFQNGERRCIILLVEYTFELMKNLLTFCQWHGNCNKEKGTPRFPPGLPTSECGNLTMHWRSLRRCWPRTQSFTSEQTPKLTKQSQWSTRKARRSQSRTWRQRSYKATRREQVIVETRISCSRKRGDKRPGSAGNILRNLHPSRLCSSYSVWKLEWKILFF